MMKLLVVLLLLMAEIHVSQAQSTRDNILINADDLLSDSETNTVQLKGNVQLVYQGQHVQCESAVVNFNEKVIEAIGDVRIRAQDVDIEAKRAIVDYSKNIGTFFDAFIQSGQVEFTGKVIHKTSEKNYVVAGGTYTACRSCPPAWSFTGYHIEAEIGGYAKIRDPVMHFGVLPVFWLPYLMVPLKSERQSGFLFPIFEYEQRQFALSQRFFWAIDRSQDAQYTAKFYKEKGIKSHINYRYVLDKKSAGSLNLGFIDDLQFRHKNPSLGPERLTLFRKDEKAFQRWFFNYQHYMELPENYVHRSKFNLVSDVQYPQDFEKDFEAIKGDPALVNEVSITKGSESTYLGIETAYYVNLLKSNPVADNSDAVHRFPEVRYSINTQRIGDSRFFFDFDLNYVNFSRSNFTYDDNFLSDTSLLPDGCEVLGENHTLGNPAFDIDPACEPLRDGKFDEGVDFIRTGQRVDIRPTVSLPFQVGRVVDFLPEFSYRETRYAFGVGERPNVVRRYFHGKLSARSTFSRVYGDLNDPKARRLKHEVQPTISWSRIPDGDFFSEKSHPFFRREKDDLFSNQSPISNSDLVTSDANNSEKYSTLQFDYNDRIFDRNLITVGVLNKWVRKTWEADVPEYKQVASLLFTQSYDARAASSADLQPYSNFGIESEISLDKYESKNLVSYFHSQKVSDINSRNTFFLENRDSFSLEYKLKFDVTKNNLWTSRAENVELGSQTRFRYVDIYAAVNFNINPLQGDLFSEAKLGTNIKPPGDCWSILLGYVRNTNKTENYSAVLSFVFDGENATSLGSEEFQQM